MENLSFNRHGQWSLNKATSDNATPTPEHFKTFRNMDREGSLKEDHGQKGSLHANPPSHGPKQTPKKALQGQMKTPVRDVYADNNPGLEPIT